MLRASCTDDGCGGGGARAPDDCGTAPRLQSEAVRMAGYLEKRGRRRLVATWRRYWFVLQGRLLLYYRSQLEYLALASCRGSLNLGLASAVRPGPTAVGGAIEVVTRAQVVTLRARDKAQRERWLAALLEAAGGAAPAPARGAHPVAHFRYSLDRLPGTQPVAAACTRRALSLDAVGRAPPLTPPLPALPAVKKRRGLRLRLPRRRAPGDATGTTRRLSFLERFLTSVRGGKAVPASALSESEPDDERVPASRPAPAPVPVSVLWRDTQKSESEEDDKESEEGEEEAALEVSIQREGLPRGALCGSASLLPRPALDELRQRLRWRTAEPTLTASTLSPPPKEQPPPVPRKCRVRPEGADAGSPGAAGGKVREIATHFEAAAAAAAAAAAGSHRSDELSMLLAQLASLTAAPLLPPPSLRSPFPNTTAADPDYDVPRPHGTALVLAAASIATEPSPTSIDAAPFLGTATHDDGEGLTDDGDLSWTALSMAPDSLETMPTTLLVDATI